MRGGNEWSGDVKQIVKRNSESCRRPAAARKNDENSKTPRLRKREYTGKVNERYAQREVCGRSNRTPVAAVRTAHTVLMRSAQKREIFAQMARTSCERCITSYIAAPHFRCCQRHRITDAGMSLDRAGGGAASGEGERLPGMILLIPASGRE